MGEFIYTFIYLTYYKDITGTPLKKGEVVSMQEDGVLALKWHDKRDVLMLSTYHDSSMVEKSRRCKGAGVKTIQKLKVVEDYNQYMGGVDLSKSIIFYSDVHA